MPDSATIQRRNFLKNAGLAIGALAMRDSSGWAAEGEQAKRPNVVFLLADQWRAQATGYAGDPNARTPALDRLAAQSVNFSNAASGCPVCCPYRASLMTGQYPLTHGVFINDVPLDAGTVSLARAFAAGGYDTAYIGKWHLYGSPDGQYGRRSAFVPREARLGFEYWKGFECSHSYNRSPYFASVPGSTLKQELERGTRAEGEGTGVPRPSSDLGVRDGMPGKSSPVEGDERTVRYWDGYDALAQSRDAARYIQDHAQSAKPFFLLVSFGPPHDPYQTAPEAYKALYADRKIELRANVPEGSRERAVRDLRGYYAHVAALDDCVELVLEAIEKAGGAERTVFVFTSDHGDMIGCRGLSQKIHPWDESIRVPFLLRYPALLGASGRVVATPIDAPDLMPTLLGLCGLPTPRTVQGADFSGLIRGERRPDPDAAALLSVPAAFSFHRAAGLPEYRGLRTARYTYVRSPSGPWLLYDNEKDPFQMRNLCTDPAHAALRADLDRALGERLRAANDEFLPGSTYLHRARLEHYREVQVRPGTWRDPWGS